MSKATSEAAPRAQRPGGRLVQRNLSEDRMRSTTVTESTIRRIVNRKSGEPVLGVVVSHRAIGTNAGQARQCLSKSDGLAARRRDRSAVRSSGTWRVTATRKSTPAASIPNAQSVPGHVDFRQLRLRSARRRSILVKRPLEIPRTYFQRQVGPRRTDQPDILRDSVSRPDYRSFGHTLGRPRQYGAASIPITRTWFRTAG